MFAAEEVATDCCLAHGGRSCVSKQVSLSKLSKNIYCIIYIPPPLLCLQVAVCVCANDDYCCAVAWDQTCVNLATSKCALTCEY